MTALAAWITLYVLGAAQTLPALRSLLRDQAVRVRFAPSTIAIGGTIALLIWPVLTVFGLVRLARNWRKPPADWPPAP